MASGREASSSLSSQSQPSGSTEQDQCDIIPGNQGNRGTKTNNSTKLIRSLVSKKDFIFNKVQSFQKNLSSLRTKCNHSPKKERKSPKRERKSPKEECRSPKKGPDKYNNFIEDDPFYDAEGSPIHLEKIHSICSELSNYQICFVELVDAEINEVDGDDCCEMAVKRKTGVTTQPSLEMDESYSKSCSNKEEEEEEEGAKSPVEDKAAGPDQDMAKSLDKEEFDTVTDRLPQVEDDLPLGSEANTFSSDMLGSKLNMLIDKRLSMLRSSPQGVSFDSNNTSSSSINSVDMLLRARSEDSEQVLMNLGFGGSFHQDIESSYNRIPERFLLNNSRAKGINLEEFLEDNPELKTYVGTLKKKGSRSGAWKAARSMSTVINQLRLSLTASRQKAVTQSDVQDDNPKSILIPENQRALAAQGFYTQHLGFKPKTGQSSHTETPKLTEEQLKSHTEAGNSNIKDAATKRKLFQKTHSTKWSLIKDGIENEHHDSSASFDYSRSMDFSTSNSMDSSDNQFSPDIRTSSISDLRRQISMDVSKKMEDDYFPFNQNNSENVGISDLSKHYVDRLSIDEDDGDYTVSPPISKQSTVERVKTMSSGSAHDDHDHVKIVVSQDIDNVFVGAENKPVEKTEFENMKYLSIGSVGSDRLSDTESSSDHTVVDKASSLDSPDIVEINQNHIEFPPLSSQYGDKSVPDENDNLISFVRAPLSQETPNSNYSPAHGEDLSRMGSLQSDSSGFGDAEYGVDPTPHESEFLKFSNPGSLNLGSSSESAATLASSVSTILACDLDTNHSQFSREEDDILSQMPTFSWQCGTSWRDEMNEELQPKPKQTYISTCYIPIAGKNIRQPYSAFHRPEIKAVDNHVSILVTNASVERSERRTCETRESVYKNSRLEPPVRESMFKELASRSNSSMFKELASPSNSSLAAHSDSYLLSPELGFGQGWQKTGHRRSQFSKSSFRYGSGDSIRSESDYSYCSTPDSIASCNHGDMMDYHKLIKLINQPVIIQGYKRSIIQYKPKKQVKEWNNLLRKKRLQEETCMLQYAIQKYKTELHSLETAFMVQFQQAYQELTEEEKDEVEELQHLWTAIHQQLLETERLLSQRLKKITSGNDFFTYISSLTVLQRMILLLREQLYQQQITVGKEDMDIVNQPAQLPLSKSQSCLGLNIPPPFTSSYLHPTLPSRVGHSLDELRDSIIKDVREEIDKSTQNLHLDMKNKKEEIQRLQFELMVEKYRKEEEHVSLVETDV